MGDIPCLYVELPLTEYQEAWELQQAIVKAKVDGILQNDVILVLEHPPVYTLGRRGGIENLCVPRTMLEEKGIAYEKLRSLYFDIGGFKEYGSLSGVDLAKIRVGHTVNMDGYEKDNPRDFTMRIF